MAPAPDIAVLIVSWQSGDDVRRALRAIETDPDAARLDVVVCDNASTDGTPDRVAREHPRVRLLRQARNLGFAGGLNAARRATMAPRLLLLNPDAEPAPGAIGRLAAALDAPGIGMVAGRLVGHDGRPQRGFNVRRFPTLPALAIDRLRLDHLWPGNPVSSRYYARDVDPDASADVEQPAAACVMVRTEVFDRLGGFDEQFWPAWWEDVDFCRRVRAAGWRIRYEPSAVFRHAGGRSVAHLGPAAFSAVYDRNLCRYVRKHHGAAAALFIGAAATLGRAGHRLAQFLRVGTARPD